MARTRLFEAWRGRTSALSPRVKRSDLGPIGLEFGRDRLRLVQLERRGGELALRAIASHPMQANEELPDPETLRAGLTQMLRASPFQGRRIVTVLPGGHTKLMVVNFDPDQASDLDAHVARLVQERTDEPIDGYVVDYRPIRTDEEHRGPHSALVAVARREEVLRFLDLMSAVRLEVEALDIVPLAVHRLVGWLSRNRLTSHSLVLHCGRRRTHLIGLAGRRLVLYRDVDFGEADVVEALAKGLDLEIEEARAVLERYGAAGADLGHEPQEDAERAIEIAETVGEILKPTLSTLTEEVERAAVYTASQWRGARLEQAALLGAFSRWNGIDRLIEGLVSIPTVRLDPLAELAGVEDGASDPDFALAVGLALRGLVEGQ